MLADRANEHIIVSLHWAGPIGENLREHGITVHALHLDRRRAPGLRALGRLWKIIRSTRPDVVQSWMYHPNLLVGLIGRSAGARNICWNIRRFSFDTQTLPMSTRLVARVGALLSCAVPKAVVYCANTSAERHVELGYCARNAVVIHNGFDTQLFSPSEELRTAVRTELGVSAATPLLGSVGRFHPDKDYATLLRAIKQVAQQHSDLRCALVGLGLGPENSELVSMVDALSLTKHVILLGERTDIPAVLNALDLHVSSSLTEGFPNVIVEAMACGTPCVSTDAGDARAIVGEYGLIVRPQSPAALANAICGRLELRFTPAWKRLSDGVHERAEQQFGIPAMVAGYQKLWSGVSGRRTEA